MHIATYRQPTVRRFLSVYGPLLEELCKGMRREGVDEFVHTTSYFGRDEIFYQKGIYPYNYVNGPSKLDETALPPKVAFYNSLMNEHSMHARAKCGSAC